MLSISIEQVSRKHRFVKVAINVGFQSKTIKRRFQLNMYDYELLIHLLSRICLILSIIKATEHEDALFPTDQELPLIFINVYNHLELATGMEIIKTGLLKKRKKIQFDFYFYQNQEFYCPAETTKQINMINEAIKVEKEETNLIGEKVDEDCLLKKKKPNKGMTIPTCKKTLKPKIMKTLRKKSIEDSEDEINNESKNLHHTSQEIFCGPSDEGKILTFGYLVCIKLERLEKIMLRMRGEKYPFRKVKQAHIYELCYNANKKEIVYTAHTITAPSLLYHNSLKSEREKKLEMKAYNSIHIPTIDFEKIKTGFENIENFKTSKYKLQLLVPAEDFPFASWRRTTYHYANASLIHEELQPCWNDIHKMIRENAINTRKLYNLYTGAFTLSSDLRNIKIIEGIEIPNLWVKIVHLNTRKEKSSLAIIANNYRDTAVDELITKKYGCDKNLCKYFIAEKFSNVLKNIRCCAVTRSTQALFGIELEFETILSINNLTTS